MRKLFVVLGLSIPFYNIQIPIINLSITTVIALIFLVLLLVTKTKLMIASLRNSLAVWAILGSFYLFISISTFISPIMRSQWMNEVIPLTLRMIFFIIPFIFICTLETLKLALRTYFLGSWAIAVSAFLVGVGWLSLPFMRTHTTRIGPTTFTRSPGLVTNFADIAIYFGFALLVIFLGLLFDKKGWIPYLVYIFTFILFGAALLFAQSRNVLVTIIVVLLLVVFIPIPRKSLTNLTKISILFFSGTFILFISLYITLLQNLWNDFINLGSGRLTMFQIAWQHILERPFIGYGLGAFTNMTDYRFEVHNVFLQTLYSGGVLSAVFLFGLIVLPLAKMVKFFFLQRAKVPYRYFALYAGMLIILLWAGSFYPAINAIVFWFSLGTLTAIPYIRELSPRVVYDY